MKTLTIALFALTMQYCSRQVDDTIPIIGTGSHELSDNNQYFDSGRYQVKRLFYKTGEKLFESFTDTISKIAIHKTYDHGQLRQEGHFDTEHGFHVGVWTFYSDGGDTKIIDFDSSKQVSYFRAVQIAKEHGFKNGRLEIDEVMLDQRLHWKVTNWTDEHAGGGIGKYILIRRSTGEVTVPPDSKAERLD